MYTPQRDVSVLNYFLGNLLKDLEQLPFTVEIFMSSFSLSKEASRTQYTHKELDSFSRGSILFAILKLQPAILLPLKLIEGKTGLYSGLICGVQT